MCLKAKIRLGRTTPSTGTIRVVHYESIKRELKISPIYECRFDERLQTKFKEFALLGYTGLFVELEHLKIETRLIVRNDIKLFFGY